MRNISISQKIENYLHALCNAPNPAVLKKEAMKYKGAAAALVVTGIALIALGFVSASYLNIPTAAAGIILGVGLVGAGHDVYRVGKNLDELRKKTPSRGNQQHYAWNASGDVKLKKKTSEQTEGNWRYVTSRTLLLGRIGRFVSAISKKWK